MGPPPGNGEQNFPGRNVEKLDYAQRGMLTSLEKMLVTSVPTVNT
jgi:hypothetical protein